MLRSLAPRRDIPTNKPLGPVHSLEDIRKRLEQHEGCTYTEKDSETVREKTVVVLYDPDVRRRRERQLLRKKKKTYEEAFVTKYTYTHHNARPIVDTKDRVRPRHNRSTFYLRDIPSVTGPLPVLSLLFLSFSLRAVSSSCVFLLVLVLVLLLGQCLRRLLGVVLSSWLASCTIDIDLFMRLRSDDSRSEKVEPMTPDVEQKKEEENPGIVRWIYSGVQDIQQTG